MENCEDYPENLRFTLSEPGFTKHREQQIGRELRTISDCFLMESGGFVSIDFYWEVLLIWHHLYNGLVFK